MAAGWPLRLVRAWELLAARKARAQASLPGAYTRQAEEAEYHAQPGDGRSQAHIAPLLYRKLIDRGPFCVFGLEDGRKQAHLAYLIVP
jgi:hypothetical protein